MKPEKLQKVLEKMARQRGTTLRAVCLRAGMGKNVAYNLGSNSSVYTVRRVVQEMRLGTVERKRVQKALI